MLSKRGRWITEVSIAPIERTVEEVQKLTGSLRGVPSVAFLFLGVGAEQRDSDAQQAWLVGLSAHDYRQKV